MIDATTTLSVKDGVIIAGVVIGWIGLAWRLASSTTEKINGLGTRVRTVEENCNTHKTKLDTLEDLFKVAQADRAVMHEKLGGVVASNSSLGEQMVEVKIEVIGHINEVKTILAEQNSKLRERVVRLETVNEIERKIGRPLTELEKS